MARNTTKALSTRAPKTAAKRGRPAKKAAPKNLASASAGEPASPIQVTYDAGDLMPVQRDYAALACSLPAAIYGSRPLVEVRIKPGLSEDEVELTTVSAAALGQPQVSSVAAFGVDDLRLLHARIGKLIAAYDSNL